jgi:hypothetical protein
MTSLGSLRMVRFARSIHMRRSTVGLVAFFLLTVAVYLLVRPTPEHVVQARRAAQPAVSGDYAANEGAPTPAPRHTVRTPATAATPRPSATPTVAPDPSATAASSASPATTVTPTPSADSGLPRSDGASPSPGQSTAATTPAPAPGFGATGAATQP